MSQRVSSIIDRLYDDRYVAVPMLGLLIRDILRYPEWNMHDNMAEVIVGDENTVFIITLADSLVIAHVG